MSGEEFDQARFDAAWVEMDVDNNGSLSMEEMKNVCKKCMNPYDEATAEGYFNSVRGTDDKITKEEMEILMKKK